MLVGKRLDVLGPSSDVGVFRCVNFGGQGFADGDVCLGGGVAVDVGSGFKVVIEGGETCFGVDLETHCAGFGYGWFFVSVLEMWCVGVSESDNLVKVSRIFDSALSKITNPTLMIPRPFWD